MIATNPCKFIGFGAMDVTRPYEYICFGAMYCYSGNGDGLEPCPIGPGLWLGPFGVGFQYVRITYATHRPKTGPEARPGAR